MRRAHGLARAPRHHQSHSPLGAYISDVVFGAHDGLVTTFAIVAGAAGAGLSNTIVLVLGFANLIADGLSMGLGEYLGRKSEIAYYLNEREKEQKEIQKFPKREQQTVRQIFAEWGFRGATLSKAVIAITKHRRAWLDLLLKYELGATADLVSRPSHRAFAMFASFVVAGFFPLLPFVLSLQYSFVISIVLSGLTMFTVGALRSHFTTLHWLRAGLEVLFIGTIAASSAYGIGLLITALVGSV